MAHAPHPFTAKRGAPSLSQRRMLQETHIEGHAEQVRRVDDDAYRRLAGLLAVLEE